MFLYSTIIGPLDACRDFLNAEGYFNDCVYDVCSTNLETQHLCKNIEVYVTLCRERGGNPGKWWKYVPECGKKTKENFQLVGGYSQ